MGAIINSQNVMLRGNNSFVGVTTDDSLSGNGTSASPLGVISAGSATYDSDGNVIVNTYLSSIPANYVSSVNNATPTILSGSISNHELTLSGNVPTAQYYVDDNMSGSGTSAKPWGLNDSINLTNNFFGRSATYSFGTAALRSDNDSAELYPHKLEMNGIVDNEHYEGGYKADGFGTFGKCTGYTSEYMPMNSNSGVQVPAMDYVNIGCANPKGIFEVQGGPGSNTNGIYGVQLSPSNVMTWTGWSRLDFSRQYVDGFQIWRLAQATGQPVAYWRFDSMQFCKNDGTSSVYFSLSDLHKLKQLINNM